MVSPPAFGCCAGPLTYTDAREVETAAAKGPGRPAACSQPRTLKADGDGSSLSAENDAGVCGELLDERPSHGGGGR